MAVYARIIYMLTGLTGVHSITTVSKVSVKTGKSISIPCLYESQYKYHVKYLCEGYYWNSCSDVVKTNTADPSGKYSISDDKKQQIFTVTINQLAYENTDYWCVVEINNGADYRKYFKLSVTSGTPSLHVNHQRITGYIGESTTIRCHHSYSGEMKWCRLGRNCVTGSSGSIDGTTVTTYMSEPNVFTVTMSGLQSEDSGWYWCAKEDIQIPVYLTVTEKPITTTASTVAHVTGNGTIHTFEDKQERVPFDLKILIIPLSLLVVVVIVAFLIWFIMRQKLRKAESTPTAKIDEEVTYASVRNVGRKTAEGSFTEGDGEITYSSVVTIKNQSIKMVNIKHDSNRILFPTSCVSFI
ncbi:polymeric immunoglobulin receptor-like isoform X1 [Astatotilapia calliptera]|uniref:polymeric immunoglobulin receptor-like isoform X1 n=1 Tax=Astatotilapia calliptera TaxID=8154 RepID=UPI000E424EEA|nr:polymeric immunoglobulin receptor-like isoform X1 [Astatotilapia calliptera]